MSIAIRSTLVGLFLAVSLAPSLARATTELPSLGDARSVALGGTGVAFLHNPSAVYLNPASLDGVQKLSITADFSPLIITGHAPLAFGPGGPQQTNLQTSFVPSFLVGAAYRVHERATIALAAYPAIGIGATYPNVVPGHDLSESYMTIEAAPAVSVRLLDNLAIGATYRISYTDLDIGEPSQAPAPAPAGTLLQNTFGLNGINFAGLSAGIYYRPIDDIELGFDYRSKITTTLSGQLTSTPPAGTSQSFNATTTVSNPHSFRLGSAFWLLDRRLMLAADAKVLLYQDSNGGASVINVSTPGPGTTISQPQNWNNVVAGSLGAEYAVTPMIAARVGYSVTTSATPYATVGPIGVPNTLVHAIHAGAGLVLDRVNVDLGGFYAFDSSDVADSNPAAGGPVPGNYANTIVMIAASGTYHF